GRPAPDARVGRDARRLVQVLHQRRLVGLLLSRCRDHALGARLQLAWRRVARCPRSTPGAWLSRDPGPAQRAAAFAGAGPDRGRKLHIMVSIRIRPCRLVVALLVLGVIIGAIAPRRSVAQEAQPAPKSPAESNASAASAAPARSPDQVMAS